jgi:hypothetical protein
MPNGTIPKNLWHLNFGFDLNLELWHLAGRRFEEKAGKLS